MPSFLFTDSRHPAAVLRYAAAVALGVVLTGLALAQPNEDLRVAVVNDRVAQVRELLGRGVDANGVDAQGEPMLLIAARNGSAGSVDALLAAGAKVDARNPFGDSALMVAAITGNLEVAKKLRQKGAALEGPAWTPLIYAATGGHEAMVTYLLAEGANINAVSPNGTTALMMAIREAKVPVAMLLLTKGADLNKRNQNGATALSWAMRGNEKALVDALRRAGAAE